MNQITVNRTFIYLKNSHQTNLWNAFPSTPLTLKPNIIFYSDYLNYSNLLKWNSLINVNTFFSQSPLNTNNVLNKSGKLANFLKFGQLLSFCIKWYFVYHFCTFSEIIVIPLDTQPNILWMIQLNVFLAATALEFYLIQFLSNNKSNFVNSFEFVPEEGSKFL